MNHLTNKVCELFSIEEINDSNSLLDIYYLELKYYKSELKRIEENKPFFFQKKKLKKYEVEKKYLEDRINNCNLKIKNECDFITKIVDN